MMQGDPPGGGAPTVQCAACGRSMDTRNELPGSEVRCVCGAMVAVPTASRRGGRSLKCPRCGDPLVLTEEAGILVRECNGCGGMFADRRTVESIGSAPHASAQPAGVSFDTQDRGSAPKIVDVDRYIKCPMCDEMMSRTTFGKRSGVVIDVCMKHGTWFDAKELSQALAFVTSGGLDREVPSVRGRSEEEARLREQAAQAAAQMQAVSVGDGARGARQAGSQRWFAGTMVALVFEWMKK